MKWIIGLFLGVARLSAAHADDGAWYQTVLLGGEESLRLQYANQFDEFNVRAVTDAAPNPCGKHAPIVRQSASVTSAISPRMAARTEVICPGGRITSVTTWYSVEAYADVEIAHHDLDVGRAIGLDDTDVERRDVARLRGLPLARGSLQQDPYRCKVPLRKGDPILSSQVEPVPAIQAGSAVTGVYRSGAMTLQFSGTAMRDANVGGMVTVQRMGAAEMLSARVSAPGQVELIP